MIISFHNNFRYRLAVLSFSTKNTEQFFTAFKMYDGKQSVCPSDKTVGIK
jgi:hypothetical protein